MTTDKPIKKLPILNQDINCYMNYSFLLGILFNYEECLPWIYSNFIQILYSDSNVPVFFFSPGTIYGNAGFLTYENISRLTLDNNKINIVEFFIDCINNNNYIATFANRYYIPERISFKKYTDWHDILIFGYDIANKNFDVLGYDDRGVHRETKVSFEDLEKSLDNSDPDRIITLCRINKKVKYHFNFRNMHELLEDYIYSKNSWHRLNAVSNNDPGTNNAKTTWGISCYNIIIKHIENIIEKDANRVDIRLSKILSDHKKMMVLRLEYIKKHKLINNIDNILEVYRKIESDSEYTLNCFLKYNIRHDKRMLEKAIQSIRTMENEEYNVLYNLLQLVKQRIAINNFLKVGTGNSIDDVCVNNIKVDPKNKIYITFIISEAYNNIYRFQCELKNKWNSDIRGMIPVGWLLTSLNERTMKNTMDYIFQNKTENDFIMTESPEFSTGSTYLLNSNFMDCFYSEAGGNVIMFDANDPKLNDNIENFIKFSDSVVFIIIKSDLYNENFNLEGLKNICDDFNFNYSLLRTDIFFKIYSELVGYEFENNNANVLQAPLVKKEKICDGNHCIEYSNINIEDCSSWCRIKFFAANSKFKGNMEIYLDGILNKPIGVIYGGKRNIAYCRTAESVSGDHTVYLKSKGEECFDITVENIEFSNEIPDDLNVNTKLSAFVYSDIKGAILENSYVRIEDDLCCLTYVDLNFENCGGGIELLLTDNLSNESPLCGNVEIRLDSQYGNVIGSCALSMDKIDDSKSTVTIDIEHISGKHDIYIIFKNCKDMKFNWFKFTPDIYNYVNATWHSESSGTYDIINVDPKSHNVGYITDGTYLVFNHVDFKDGAVNFEVYAGKPINEESYIELRINNVNGPVIGKCDIIYDYNNKGWHYFIKYTCPILKIITGKHDLYLIFKGGGGCLFNLRDFKFNNTLSIHDVDDKYMGKVYNIH